MRKSTLATLAACAAIIAGLAVPVAAPAATIPTTVTINFVDRPGADLFRGRVKSPNNNCVSDRGVRLFRARPSGNQLIDTDESEDNGSWDIDVEGDPAPGTYFVRVTPKAVGGDTCATAISRRIAVAG